MNDRGAGVYDGYNQAVTLHVFECVSVTEFPDAPNCQGDGRSINVFAFRDSEISPSQQRIENLNPTCPYVDHTVAYGPANNPKARDDRDVLRQRTPVKRHTNLVGAQHLGIHKRVLRIKEEVIGTDNRHVFLRMMKPFRLLWHDVVAQFNALPRTGMKYLLSSVCRLVRQRRSGRINSEVLRLIF